MFVNVVTHHLSHLRYTMLLGLPDIFSALSTCLTEHTAQTLHHFLGPLDCALTTKGGGLFPKVACDCTCLRVERPGCFCFDTSIAALEALLPWYKLLTSG